jgi:ribosomal protein S18 acetylase RimI-like enzyme
MPMQVLKIGSSYERRWVMHATLGVLLVVLAFAVSLSNWSVEARVLIAPTLAAFGLAFFVGSMQIARQLRSLVHVTIGSTPRIRLIPPVRQHVDALAATIDGSVRDELGWDFAEVNRLLSLIGRSPITLLSIVDRPGGTVVGAISCVPDLAAQSTMILTGWIGPAHRRLGLASEAVRAVCDVLARQDYEYVSVEIRAGNDAALRLLEATGFATAGERHRMASDEHDQHVLIMQRRLTEVEGAAAGTSV